MPRGARAWPRRSPAKHGDGSAGGAVLRLVPARAQLDGLMLDFYLIVSDYRAAYGKRWLAAANRLIPPNVFPVRA